MINIILIPKCTRSNTMAKFRPISLCNVIYKIVTKAIVNRFKGVLDLCIDNSQSVFVPDRLIFDNALIAYEMLHTFKYKRFKNRGYMALKLDMSKIYDKVEWHFLRAVMSRMGFLRKWIKVIMKCIFTILIQ